MGRFPARKETHINRAEGQNTPFKGRTAPFLHELETLQYIFDRQDQKIGVKLLQIRIMKTKFAGSGKGHGRQPPHSLTTTASALAAAASQPAAESVPSPTSPFHLHSQPPSLREMFGLLRQCVQWEDRAAGICGKLRTVTTQSNEEVSNSACLRGAGGETPLPAEPQDPCIWLSLSRFDGVFWWVGHCAWIRRVKAGAGAVVTLGRGPACTSLVS